MTEKEKKRTESYECEGIPCPFRFLASCFQGMFQPHPEFRKHLYNSRIEFLKGIRSLLDDCIENLERKGERGGKKAVKVEVE